MKSNSPLRPLALALVAIVVFAPGWPAVARSPYGLQPLELWLAAAYLVVASTALLLFFSRLQRHFSSSTTINSVVVLVIFVLAWPPVVFLPHAVVTGIYQLVGPFPFGSRALLLTKYSGHFIAEAVRWHTWLLAVVVLGVLLWSSKGTPQTAPQVAAKNAP